MGERDGWGEGEREGGRSEERREGGGGGKGKGGGGRDIGEGYTMITSGMVVCLLTSQSSRSIS